MPSRQTYSTDLSWRTSARPPLQLPANYDERIDSKSIYVLDYNPDTGEPGEFFVTPAHCDRCVQLRRVCSRGDVCKRCTVAKANCVTSDLRPAPLAGFYKLRSRSWKARTEQDDVKTRNSEDVIEGHPESSRTVAHTRSTTSSRYELRLASNLLPPSPEEIFDQGLIEAENDLASGVVTAGPSRVKTRSNKRKSQSSGRGTYPYSTPLASSEQEPSSAKSGKRRKPNSVAISVDDIERKPRKAAVTGPIWRAVVPEKNRKERPDYENRSNELIDSVSANDAHSRLLPLMRPHVWSSTRAELCEVLPELSKSVNGVYWDDSEVPIRPILFIEGDTWEEDGWINETTVELNFVRDLSIPAPSADRRPPLIIPTTNDTSKHGMLLRSCGPDGQDLSEATYYPPMNSDQALILSPSVALLKPHSVTPLVDGHDGQKSNQLHPEPHRPPSSSAGIVQNSRLESPYLKINCICSEEPPSYVLISQGAVAFPSSDTHMSHELDDEVAKSEGIAHQSSPTDITYEDAHSLTPRISYQPCVKYETTSANSLTVLHSPMQGAANPAPKFDPAHIDGDVSLLRLSPGDGYTPSPLYGRSQTLGTSMGTSSEYLPNVFPSPADGDESLIDNACPPEIQALIDAHSTTIAIAIIIHQDSPLLPCVVPPECGYSILGFFNVTGWERGAAESPASSMASRLHGTHTHRIKWKFKFQWAPGGDSFFTQSQPQDEVYPWWINPGLRDTKSTDNCLYKADRSRDYSIRILSRMLRLESSLITDKKFNHGWYCRGCGKLNVIDFLSHRVCSHCPPPNEPILGFPVELDRIRSPLERSSSSALYDEDVAWSKETWMDGMQTHSFRFGEKGLVKHISTDNQRELQIEATQLFRDIQIYAKISKQTATSRAQAPFCYLAGSGHENEAGVVPWKDAPGCIAQSRELMEHTSRSYGEEEAIQISKFNILVWVGPGTRKGFTFSGSPAHTVVLCLGNNAAFTIVPKSQVAAEQPEGSISAMSLHDQSKSESGDCGPPGIFQIAEGEGQGEDARMDVEPLDTPADTTLQLLGSDCKPVALPDQLGAPLPSKARRTRAVKPSQPLLVTLSHGDVMIFSGDEFQVSIRRTGMTMLLVGSCAPVVMSEVK